MSILKKIWANRIIRNLIFILLFFVIVIMLALLWLRIYTNHGQKLELPDYTEIDLREAIEDAEKKSFEIIVSDSVHIVGKKGGMIMAQNPKPQSMVKENRKIYVTTTKFIADQIDLKALPTLYGNDYERKKKELSYSNIYSNVKSYKYDSGEPDHILEVWYKGRQIVNSVGKKSNIKINKGDSLSFVLSKRSGAEIVIPDLICKSLAEAKFYLEQSRINIGTVVGTGGDSDMESYITEQSPRADGKSTLIMGEAISIRISNTKPKNCK